MVNMTELDFKILEDKLKRDYADFEGYEGELIDALYYTYDMLGGNVAYNSPEEMQTVYTLFQNSIALYEGIEMYITAVLAHSVQEYLVGSVGDIDLDVVWGDEDVKRILALPEMSQKKLTEAEILKICGSNISDDSLEELVNSVVEEVCHEAMHIMMEYYIEDIMLSKGKSVGVINATVDITKFAQELLEKSIEFNNIEDLCKHLAKNNHIFLVRED